MDRINGADWVDIGGGRRGFRAEDLPSGTTGTEVTDVWLNMVQEEIVKVIEAAGLGLNPADWTQLYKAIGILAGSSVPLSKLLRLPWMYVISMTLSSAPGAPSAGDVYFIPSNATGVWAANIGKFAEWTGSAWSYLTPMDGHGFSLPDGRVYERIAGTYVEKIAIDAQSGKWNYAVAGGTVNALTVTLSPAPASLAALVGMPVRAKVSGANTGAATLNVNGLGAVPIVKFGAAALTGAELNGISMFIYDGTNFELFSQASIVLAPGASTTKAPKLIGGTFTGTGTTVPTSVGTTLPMTTLDNNLYGTSVWSGTQLTIGAGEGGLWELSAEVGFPPGAGAYYQSVGVLKNGAAAMGANSVPGSGNSGITRASGILKLVPGDILTFTGYQQSGNTYASTAQRASAYLISAN